MLEKLVRSTRSVVGGVLLVLVFVTDFMFVSVEALEGNGTTLWPVPFGVVVEMAILQGESAGLSLSLNPARPKLYSSEIQKRDKIMKER